MRTCGKPIVLYGMGNGADKILMQMERHGISVSDFFASDDFVRGQCFHGKEVLSYSAVQKKYDDMLIVIAFGSSRPELLARFAELAATYETIAPDVPIAGDTCFTYPYYLAHYTDFVQTYQLLADDASRVLYCDLIAYKISGKLAYLFRSTTTEELVDREILHPETIEHYADLGAYNGDTVRQLILRAPHLKTVYAMEPDARNYKKLAAYAAQETRTAVYPFPYAAWSTQETLSFCAEGNRNSSAAQNETSGIAVSQGKTCTVEAAALDTVLAGKPVDFIKYDVEGAEQKALLGSRQTIVQQHPRLLVSLYHRTEDLYALPQIIVSMAPSYQLYLRRFPSVPAWDINLYCI